MPVDNSELLCQFVPSSDDGDTFIYTEILDRTVRVGNNSARLLRTFYHRSLADFDRHMGPIRAICDATGARAYTRIAQRSFKAVGKLFAKLVTDAVVSENWAGMKTLYGSACGKVTPNVKLWMFDIDEMTPDAHTLAVKLDQLGVLVVTVPSRRGVHLVTKAFDVRQIGDIPSGTSLHKQCTTNLYIPDGVIEHNKGDMVERSETLHDKGSTDVQRSITAPQDPTGEKPSDDGSSTVH